MGNLLRLLERALLSLAAIQIGLFIGCGTYSYESFAVKDRIDPESFRWTLQIALFDRQMVIWFITLVVFTLFARAKRFQPLAVSALFVGFVLVFYFAKVRLWNPL